MWLHGGWVCYLRDSLYKIGIFVLIGVLYCTVVNVPSFLPVQAVCSDQQPGAGQDSE